ncbi:hypothetical protein AKO1_000938 [Acrasis kona]|uniref:PiggyBac transposable element-derived protein domain-containing protein n=1 Tax=Acrasis kona TaxID=1008807 RepID=A0AAW2ZRI2_9EUKA
MQAVDIADSKVSKYYPHPHRNTKWTRTYFFMMLKVCLVNAFLNMRQDNTVPNEQADSIQYNQLEFIHDVIVGVRVEYKCRVRRNKACHQLVALETRSSVCKNCRKRGSTCYHKCEQCNVPLHKKCFVEYHSKGDNPPPLPSYN